MDLLSSRTIYKYADGSVKQVDDAVIKEYPFTIFLNGKRIITLLCSPRALDYLSIGFLLSEGLMQNKEDIIDVKIDEEKGISEIEIEGGFSKELFENRAVTTGACKGTVFYNAIEDLLYKKIESPIRINISDIFKLVEQFNKRSQLFRITGGVHSTCIANEQKILIFHEDVGRHNALDKAIGEAFIKELPLEDKIILTSGRISSEIIIKCAKRKVPIIISRAAPTDLALKLGKEYGITIVGFTRPPNLNIYTINDRIYIKQKYK